MESAPQPSSTPVKLWKRLGIYYPDEDAPLEIVDLHRPPRRCRREWTRLEIVDAPPPREAAMSAYVEEEERFFVFGGLGESRMNDLWELRATESSPRE